MYLLALPVIKISLESVNKAIRVLNNEAPISSSSFTFEQLENIFSDKDFHLPATKIIILGLVQLKKMDICSEKDKKVYKIRI